MTRTLEAIVYDFDGVIADSERLHLQAYQDVMAPLGLALSSEDYYARYVGYDDRRTLQIYSENHALGWDADMTSRLITAKSARYEALTAQGEMLYPGAAAFIRAAADVVPIAIASGALTHEIEDILDTAGLRECFIAVVGADQTERSKPSPDPYLEAVHRITVRGYGLDPSCTVAIEDSRWGLVSAATAKLRCVAVTNTYTAAELAPHAELVVPGLHALTLAALNSLCASLPASAIPRSSGTP